MGLLLCRYASKRSRPETIRAWTDDLIRMQRNPQLDAGDRQVVERLLLQANRWLAEKTAQSV